ncbi:Zeta-crystallin [Arthrobotrys entomopaga]|nr:Zeta-crystallin [Arthrobotrys entomopaga]
MSPTSYKQVVYAERPDPTIIPDKTFNVKTASLPTSLKPNEILVRAHYLSLDAAMRSWLTAKRSYIAPVELNDVMRGSTVSQIHDVGSAIDSNKFKKGDWVVAMSGWAEYAVLTEKLVERLDIPEGCSPKDFMSVLGITGLTAYFGLEEIGHIKPGETVVVSGAAGATGSMAGQIAKVKGARVIGIAGGQDKCDFLTSELGFDAAVDYKNPNWKQQLRDLTPKYIDVYFDNVGGEILNFCLGRAARDSRFVICGAISQYNTATPQGPANFINVISQRITIKGFIVFDYAKKYNAARKDLAQWLKEGKLKRKEHIVAGGIEKAPAALVDLYAGGNTGKMLVEIAPMSEALPESSKL